MISRHFVVYDVELTTAGKKRKLFRHYEFVFLWVVCHYANTPMQYIAIFHDCKNDNFHLNYFDYFHIFAQNIDRGYTLEPPQ